jgi:precorrin-2 dehydrogenase / sirohydrochlorin ferrochelatase
VVDRKKFLYSLINDKYIQDLLKEDRIEDAKSSTIELLEKWGEHSK